MDKKIDLARRQGMSYAYRIAKEQGIDALEKDLKSRCAHNIPVGIQQKDLDQLTLKVKNNVIDTMLILAVATLRDEFGFGQKRAQQFVDRFNDKAGCIGDGYCSWEDYITTLKSELNIDFSIRRNDESVKVEIK